MSNSKSIDSPDRRNFLEMATGAVGAAGVAAAAWPFVQSMNPSSDVLAKGVSEADLASIPLGEAHTVAWQGKPVFIVHRKPEVVAAMQASSGGKDPEPDQKRAQKPEWLVVVGVCTHLGCVPSRTEEGWLCPCHGSVYDNSGRIMHGPAPANLEVPLYHFVGTDKIIIGEA